MFLAISETLVMYTTEPLVVTIVCPRTWNR